MNQIIHRQLRYGVSLFALVAFMGCGKPGPAPDKEPRYKVEGVVSLNGQPTGGINVIYNPRGATVGRGGWGVTDESGKYTITDYNTVPGLQSGGYYVTFSKRTLPDGSPIPAGKQLDNSTPTIESLPRQMTTVVQQHNHPYYVELKADTSNSDFDLKVPKK